MKKVYICSLILSILHSILFWGKQIGISMILFTVTTIIFLMYLLKRGKTIKNEKEIFWSIPILLLSGTYFIFNNAIFRVLNIIAIIVLMTIMIIELTKKQVTLKGYLIKFIEIILRPLELLDSVIMDLKNRIVSGINKKGDNELSKKVIQILLIVVPIVILVLILLASADSIFRDIFSSFENIFKNIKISEVVFRTALAVILFIYFACFSVNLIKKDSPYNEREMEKGEGVKV